MQTNTWISRALLTCGLVLFAIPAAAHHTAPPGGYRAVGQKDLTFQYSPGTAPNHLALPFEFARHVYGYLSYNVDPATGNLRQHFLVTNSVRHRGFTVCVFTTFFGDRNSLHVQHQLGVDARYARRHDSRNDETKLARLGPEVWKTIKTVRVVWGWCPSDRILAKPIEAVVKLFQSDIGIAGFPVPPPDGSLTVAADVRCQGPVGTGYINLTRSSKISCADARSKLNAYVGDKEVCEEGMGGGWRETGVVNWLDTTSCLKQ